MGCEGDDVARRHASHSIGDRGCRRGACRVFGVWVDEHRADRIDHIEYHDRCYCVIDLGDEQSRLRHQGTRPEQHRRRIRRHPGFHGQTGLPRRRRSRTAILY
jgi:hypothetical protein